MAEEMKRRGGEYGQGDGERRRKVYRPPGMPPSTSIAAYADAAFPSFALPSELGSFSTDGSKQFLHDKSRLRFLSLPPRPNGLEWNLDSGFSSYIPDETSTFLSLILQWVEAEQKKTGRRLVEVLGGANVLCWRGALTRIGATPYARRDGWRLAVVRYRDIFFLGEFKTPEQEKSEQRRSEQEQHFTYWGHRFEDFLCADAEGRKDLERPVNGMECFCLVVRTKLDGHRLTFAGEVDCQDPVSKEYLELKTNRVFSAQKQLESFHRWKTVKWWLQSFLIGIPRVIAGLRDDEGMVRELREWTTSDLARQGQWQGSVCLNFTAAFLRYLSDSILDNDLEQVWLVEKVEGQVSLSPIRKLPPDQNEQFTFLSPHSKQFLSTTP